MNFRLLTAKEYPRWYHDQLSEAFVPQERKPLPDILRLLEEGRYEVWGLFDEDELLSYAALWKNATIPLVLLDYLGTTRARRNEGLGSDMLSRLEQQGRPLVAEAEFPVPGGSDAENALRLRRIQFYIRNGAVARAGAGVNNFIFAMVSLPPISCPPAAWSGRRCCVALSNRWKISWRSTRRCTATRGQTWSFPYPRGKLLSLPTG